MSSPTADGARHLHGMAPARSAAVDLQRRARLLRQWKRRSALVRLLRVLLPALCVTILAVLGGLAGVNAYLARTAVRPQRDLPMRMLKPHFQGRNDTGQPYLVTADSAVRDDVDTARITLENPVFTQGSSAPDESRVRARNGVYREDTRMLDLRGNVVLDDAQGYHFVTEHALVDTVKSNVDGDVYIQGRGPLGQIAASSYAVRNGGAYVYFTGKVKSRIERHAVAVAGGATPAKAAPPAPAAAHGE